MLGFIIVIIGILDLLFLGVNYPFDISGLFVFLFEAIYIAVVIINSKSAIKSKNLSKTDKISLGFAGLSLVEMIVYLLTESKFVGNALGVTLVIDGMLILSTSFFPQIKKFSGLTKKVKAFVISKSALSVISIVLAVCLLGHNCVTNYEFFKHAEDVKATENIQQYEVKSVDDPFGWNESQDGAFVPKNLKVNGLVTPSSLTPGAISFSWISDHAQSAFEIEIFENENIVFKSGCIEKDSYNYKPDFVSEAGKNYSWSLTLYDNAGEASETVTSTFSTGLLADDWKAEWISADADLPAPTKEDRHNASYFRTNLKVDAADIENGIDMYATAHGVYDIWINDVHVDDWYMAPGFTQYSEVLQTQHYDISKYLRAGDNKILVQVGDGWYRGSLDKEQTINSFGEDSAFLCQIQSRGNVLKITDSSWQAANDGWLGHNDMHDGEEYDARKTEDSFSWQDAFVIKGDYSVLTGNDAPKITTHEVFNPILITTPNGEKVLDFGQNFSGYVNIDVDAPEDGKTIKLTHGETLDENGNFTTRNFQASKDIITKQEVIYICKKGNNSYHQTTTYFGFRYVKVETDLDITADNFTGVAVYSDMDQTGFFTSGNALVNQLYSNTLWSMKSNFVSVMTDCPTREKSGYSGDGQIFIDTALYMMDSAPVYNAWMNSYRHMFNEDGSLMQFTPTKLTHSLFDSSHGWCDAIVIVPYKLWKQTGDISVIENYYDDSKKWVDYALERAGKKTHLVNKLKLENELEDYFADQGFGWGEWLEAGYKDKFSSVILLAHNTLMGESEVGTAFLYSSCAQMAEMAEALGKDDDAKIYSEAAEKAREAYRQVFTNNGEVTEEYRQCRYVRPITLGLLDENESKAASDKLAEIIESNNDHLNTGFLSTGSLLNSLSDYGNVTKAYDVLLQKTAPSWLYSVSQGATTIWETWDGKESLNHYSYGAVCSWLMNTAAGINYTDGQITIFPKPDARLGYAEASYDSPVGTIRSGWCYVDGELVYEVEIPAGQTATLQIGDESQIIGEGIHVIK